MKEMNKKGVLRASFLVVTLFVATFAGFIDIADAVNYTAAVTSPAIAPGGSNREITLDITNNEADTQIEAVRIDGNGNFTDFICPASFAGPTGTWDLNSNNGHCRYVVAGDGIRNGETETFVFNVTTPIVSGDKGFEVMISDNVTGWQGQPYEYPDFEIDADGPVIPMIEPLDNDWTDSLTFDLETDTITDASAIAGNCSVTFTDNDSVVHVLDDVEFAAGVCDDAVDLPGGTAEGLGSLTVSIEDEWGNTGSNTTLFGYDTIAPTSSVLALPTYTTSCDPVAVTYNFDDNTGATSVDWVKFNVSNSTGSIVRTDGMPDGTINIDMCDLGNGQLEIFAYAQDFAGNLEADPVSVDTTTYMDNVAPDFDVAVPAHNSWINASAFDVETTVITEADSGVDYCEVIYQDAGANTTLGNLTHNGTACVGQVSIADTTVNGMGALYVFVYDLAGNKGGGSSLGDDFINLGFDDDFPDLYDRAPTDAQDPGVLIYNATICDAGTGFNNDTAVVQINENGIQGWVVQAPTVNEQMNASCYTISGDIEANLRKTGESYTVEYYVEDDYGNSMYYQWNYYVRDMFTLPTLKYGKNLISTPLIPEDTNITIILDANASKVDKIYWYDPATEAFLIHNPTAPALSDLTTLEAGKGYWFYVNTEYDQTIYGYSEQGDTPALFNFADGSNMVGFKTKAVEAIEDRIVSGTISDVLVTWNTTDWIYPDQGDNLIVGQGYWLYGQGAGTYR